MYIISIPLKDLRLKIGRRADLYHEVLAYDHITTYAQIAFAVIKMEAMINYIADRKFWHAKRHFNIMCCAVDNSICTILFFIRPHIAFIMIVVFSLYHIFGSSDIPQSC